MTLEERRRYLISSQKKKNWFDFSKVTTGAQSSDYNLTSYAYGRVSGDKYIAVMGVSGTGILLKDSRTTLPKGDYVLRFTVYAPTANGIFYFIKKYIAPTNTVEIFSSGLKYNLKAETYTDYVAPFSLEEETTVVIGLQGIGSASNYRSLNYEFTNIRIEKVG